MAANAQLAPVSQHDALADATLKRKSETTAERNPVKQLNHVELGTAQADLLDDDDDSPKKPGRKPINAELPSNASNSDKRRAQNRAAQRAFRERKDRYVKELEERIQALEAMTAGKEDTEATSRLRTENDQLRELVKQLTTENRTLKEIQFTFQPPPMTETAATATPALGSKTPSAFSTPALSSSAIAAQPVGHPSPVSPLEQLNHLQTPPETSSEESHNNVYSASGISEADTVALQQMLQAAAAAMTASKDATADLSLAANPPHMLATPTTPTPATATVAPPTASAADMNVAALQLLAAQTQAPAQQAANALLAGVYATPDTKTGALPADAFAQSASSPATALAMQELLASQLFPPLAPASTSSASQSPNLAQPGQFTSPFATFSAPDTFNTDTLAFLQQNLNNPIFTDYRDTNTLSALLSEPVEVPVPGANGQPLVFDDAANALPSATIVPLEGLAGMGSPVAPAEPRQHTIASVSGDRQRLEEYCASGILSDDDLDFLCSEMKSKCRAAKEAAEAKFALLQKECTEQEKRVAHAKHMSTQLDALNTTPPLP
ncbi:hypothetical protein SYNPS1DRAFT_30976 [Syncephalis pseudoplumigaleata]|uniref:BZIP domain-containing protein n=1 Tax=Syncephalis pseudoplumigaleata TaxID=1712513 RepID=A0A4V1J0Z7_9FUNG|nr:hypothetical protein SYNPS1DRAFT_30976 [Syncephalis pseudoplumigaleata]|eukprot:RKP23299.1 hypothetical protein SYNPS1DRAFT_30976 [Syncephalis pseudoplumigaleata]